MKNQSENFKLTPEEAQEDIERFNKAAESEGLPKMNEYERLDDVQAAESLLEEIGKYKPVEHKEVVDTDRRAKQTKKSKENQEEAVNVELYKKMTEMYQKAKKKIEKKIEETIEETNEELSILSESEIELEAREEVFMQLDKELEEGIITEEEQVRAVRYLNIVCRKEREKLEAEKEKIVDFFKENELPESQKKEIKEIIKKVKDLKNDGGFLIHCSDIKNLKSILEKGILSQAFVRHHYYTYKKGFKPLPRGADPIMQARYGWDKISFFDADSGRLNISDSLDHLEWSIYQSGSVFAVLIDKKDISHLMKKSVEAKYGWDGEILLKDRVAPRFFRGLIFQYNKKIHPKKIEGALEFAKNYKIPIYSEEGWLLWPRQITSIEIQELVSRRKKQENTKDKVRGTSPSSKKAKRKRRKRKIE